MKPTLPENYSFEQLVLIANSPESPPSPLLSELAWLKLQWGRFEKRRVRLDQECAQLQGRIQVLVQQWGR
jgi:hypothetical protein